MSYNYHRRKLLVTSNKEQKMDILTLAVGLIGAAVTIFVFRELSKYQDQPEAIPIRIDEPERKTRRPE